MQYSSFYILIFCLFYRMFHTMIITEPRIGRMVELPGQGSVEGLIERQTQWTGQDIHQFLGIPYAESPSKNLRFKPPVERSKWEKVLNVTEYGKRCPTWGLHMPSSEVDYEDCLSICVYTTKFDTNRPVMFYIHGGGFYNGSSQQVKPDYLLEKDIVLAVPQYRLGVLGFLSTGTADIPGNMAILDLIMALNWVHKYISYFGGDPTSITIFGQSAGAALVTGLMVSPAVPKGSFHRAIVQSGCILSSWSEKPDSLTIAQNICKKAKCSDCTNAKEINKCLMSLDLLKLLYISTGNNLRVTDVYSMLSYDYHNVFPARPHELLKNSTKYPMIIGVTKHDGTFLLAAVYDYLGEDFKEKGPIAVIDAILKNAKQEDPSGFIRNLILKFVFNPEDLKKGDFYKMMPALIDLSSIIMMKSAALNFAVFNGRDNPHPTYMYTFDYKGQATYFGYGLDTHHYPFDGGVHHSNDYMYILATVQLYSNEDLEMAENMVDLWTSFASSGTPASKCTPKWQPFNSSEMGPYLHINRRSSLGNYFYNEFALNRCTIVRDIKTYQLLWLSVLLLILLNLEGMIFF